MTKTRVKTFGKHDAIGMENVKNLNRIIDHTVKEFEKVSMDIAKEYNYGDSTTLEMMRAAIFSICHSLVAKLYYNVEERLKMGLLDYKGLKGRIEYSIKSFHNRFMEYYEDQTIDKE